VRKLIAALVVTASALSIAGGGVGIALVDPNPTFGKTIFISLEGGGLSKHTSDTISLVCSQNGAVVSQATSLATGYGAYFQLGPTSTWKGGSAVCTAELLKPDRKTGFRVEDSFMFAVAG
jgi:hypothetical protein